MSLIDNYQLEGGFSFSVALTWGCNIFSWVVEGKEIMFCPNDHPQAAFKITGGGNPTLFPAVARTWDHSSGEPVLGSYRIYGSDKVYHMPPHGILFLCKWNKIEESQTPDSATVVYEMVIPDEVRDKNFPFDLGFTHRYTFSRDGIKLDVTVTNNGPIPAPAAFGYHPYFRISNPEREGIEIKYPVTTQMTLTSDTVLLNGESEPTDGTIKFEPGIDYTMAFANPVGRRLSLTDRGAGHVINVDFDEKCELFLAWSPGGSDFICMEPWTRGLGAFEYLKDPGWENGEFIPVLQPGDVTSYITKFSVSEVVA